MAHSKSAKKAARQNAGREMRNKSVRTFFRDKVKAFREVLATGDRDKAAAAFKEAVSAIATARSKGVIQKNTAGRYVSRLNQQLNKLSAK